MKKKYLALFMVVVMLCAALVGCKGNSGAPTETKAPGDTKKPDSGKTNVKTISVCLASDLTLSTPLSTAQLTVRQ